MSTNNDAASLVAPPSEAVIALAWVDLVFSAFFFLLSGFIAWRHGKQGLTCWSILTSAFVARLVADIYQIVTKDQPMLPNVVTLMTDAAVTACISLAIIGIVYECNTILPTSPKNISAKITLGLSHLFNTIGIAAAAYGGAPSATGAGGVRNQELDQIGNLILLFVLLAVCGWLRPTYHRVQHHGRTGRHPNAAPARRMLVAAAAAAPFWLVRLGYRVAYAFHHLAALDPVTGAFATKLVLVFGTYLGAAVALLVGGLLGMGKVPVDMTAELLGAEDARMLRGEGTDVVEMSVRPKQ